MNNNCFDFKRFGKVIKHDFHNLPSQYGIMMLVIVLFPAALWLLLLAINKDISMPTPIRWTMVILQVYAAACFTPGRLYRTWNLQREGIYFAMLPASNGEKYGSMLLFSLIICPLIALIGAVIVDSILYLIPIGCYKFPIWEVWNSVDMGGSYYWNLAALHFLRPGKLILIAVLCYIATVLEFVFAATFFKKYKILKTFLALWILQWVISILLIPLAISGFKNIADMDLSIYSQPEFIISLYDKIIFAVLIFNIVLCAVLAWWSGFRIKRMKY